MLLVTTIIGVGESRPVNQVAANPVLAYAQVLRDRRFTGLAVINALSYGGHVRLHLRVTARDHGIAWHAGPGLCRVLCLHGCVPNRWRVDQRPARRPQASRLAACCGSDWRAPSPRPLLLCLVTYTGATMVSLAILPLLINLFCRGLVAPNVQHMALDPLRGKRGHGRCGAWRHSDPDRCRRKRLGCLPGPEDRAARHDVRHGCARNAQLVDLEHGRRPFHGTALRWFPGRRDAPNLA